MRTSAFFLPTLLGLVLAGCVERPARTAGAVEARPDPGMARVIAMAADQVKRCYQAPRVGRDGRGIATVLRVAYAPDGTLAELPALVLQRGVTDENRAAAAALAEAAALAVVRCAPLKLPPERYRNGWDSFVLTFSPKAVA
jgi:hypothetical protein